MPATDDGHAAIPVRPRLRRRRFLAISAVAASLAGTRPAAAAAAVPPVAWRGQALGAMASIVLAHPDPAASQRLLAACAAEIGRLEAIFTLYRADAPICRLNAEGSLAAPPLELIELLDRCAGFSRLTGGVFDVTVQPLFRRYAEHFLEEGADPAGPDVADVLPLIGWQGVELASDRIGLARAGMALTLNGVAQGFITDRIAELLRSHGMTDVLVDVGELRALGHHPDGRAWRAGIRRPADTEPVAAVDLSELALATSSGAGSPFEESGRFNHLLDPATGRSADPARTVAVLAPTATEADALATAFALMPEARARQLVATMPAVRLLTL